jgi:serine/threonine protein kinase
MFTPISVDATESEQLKSILNEIDVLKKLSSKSDYVINYLDSFSTEVFNFCIYHIVTDIYEVKFNIIINTYKSNYLKGSFHSF